MRRHVDHPFDIGGPQKLVLLLGGLFVILYYGRILFTVYMYNITK